MAKKQKRRVVIGIHIEGSTVYLAKVRYSGGNYQLLDVQRAQLPQSAITDDSRPVLEGIEAGGINLDVESMDITIPPETEESPSGSLEFKIDESASLEDTPLVMRMFRDYRDLRYKVSAALSEPDVFYVHFGSNWGLKGKKLRGKVLQELSQIKTEKKKLKPEDYDIISMPNEQLTAVTRDKNIPLLDMIHEQKRRRRIPMPRIGCVETLETALTNLTIQFCELKEDELTVIVYIGSEHSRFIFLQGSRLMYISQQIHDGGYSKQIANILYSRLLFELDNLNIEGLNRIIICGKTKSSNVIDYMREAFAEESSVEEMDFSGIDTSGLSPEDIANLPEYAGAIGAALRLMLPENPDLIRIDITPAFIKAGQKTFKFGFPGWIFIGIITAIIAGGLYRTNINMQKLRFLQSDVSAKKTQIVYYENLKNEYENILNVMSVKENSAEVLEKLTEGSKKWSSFLEILQNNLKKSSGIWMTDVAFVNPNQVSVSGYSIYRNRITSLIKRMPGAKLDKVETQEIRGMILYKFLLKVNI